MNKNQKINCTVNSCAYNNPNSDMCELNSIIIKACPNCHNGNPADESMCGSYKNTK